MSVDVPECCVGARPKVLRDWFCHLSTLYGGVSPHRRCPNGFRYNSRDVLGACCRRCVVNSSTTESRGTVVGGAQRLLFGRAIAPQGFRCCGRVAKQEHISKRETRSWSRGCNGFLSSIYAADGDRYVGMYRTGVLRAQRTARLYGPADNSVANR